MNHGDVMKLASELVGLIEQLIDAQVSLQALVREKLEAMRRADTEAMLATVHREGETTAEVTRLDHRRQKVVSKLARALGMPVGPTDGAVTLRALADRLDGAPRERLTALANKLREEMLKLAEANRVVELVSREMLVHFKTLFSVMVQGDDIAPTYSSQGEVGPVGGARVFDAVG